MTFPERSHESVPDPSHVSQTRRQGPFGSREVLRRGVIGGVIFLGLFLVFFGIDLLDWLFLTTSGVSVLSGFKQRLNDSTALKLVFLTLWSWWVFHFALQGGMALVREPFARFVRHVDMVPERTVEFKLREGDEDFGAVVDAYNRMVSRLRDSRDQMREQVEAAKRHNEDAQGLANRLRPFL